ncbi:MAG: hypothetical protein H6732_05620, partial [Alphaproteobacteria bacterium]|nr:hypothetical protein [Alphaproteobacteria bacterium]
MRSVCLGLVLLTACATGGDDAFAPEADDAKAERTLRGRIADLERRDADFEQRLAAV